MFILVGEKFEHADLCSIETSCWRSICGHRWYYSSLLFNENDQKTCSLQLYLFHFTRFTQFRELQSNLLKTYSSSFLFSATSRSCPHRSFLVDVSNSSSVRSWDADTFLVYARLLAAMNLFQAQIMNAKSHRVVQRFTPDWISDVNINIDSVLFAWWRKSTLSS